MFKPTRGHILHPNGMYYAKKRTASSGQSGRASLKRPSLTGAESPISQGCAVLARLWSVTRAQRAGRAPVARPSSASIILLKAWRRKRPATVAKIDSRVPSSNASDCVSAYHTCGPSRPGEERPFGYSPSDSAMGISLSKSGTADPSASTALRGRFLLIGAAADGRQGRHSGQHPRSVRGRRPQSRPARRRELRGSALQRRPACRPPFPRFDDAGRHPDQPHQVERRHSA